MAWDAGGQLGIQLIAHSLLLTLSLSLPLYCSVCICVSREKNSKDGGLEGRRVQEVFGEKRSQRNILDPTQEG